MGLPILPREPTDRHADETVLDLTEMDESNMAAIQTEPATSSIQLNNSTPTPMPPNLEAYFKNATESFEQMVRNAVLGQLPTR